MHKKHDKICLAHFAWFLTNISPILHGTLCLFSDNFDKSCFDGCVISLTSVLYILLGTRRFCHMLSNISCSVPSRVCHDVVNKLTQCANNDLSCARPTSHTTRQAQIDIFVCARKHIWVCQIVGKNSHTTCQARIFIILSNI